MPLPTLQAPAVLAHGAARQGLGSEPFPGDIPALTRALVGLHATEPTSIHLSAWARLAGFERGHLERALFEERTVLRWLAMRRTLWVVAAEDVPMAHQAAVPRLLGPEERRLHKALVLAELCDQAEAPALLRDIEARILAAVEERGEAYGSELSELIPEMAASFPYAPDKPWGGRVALGSRLSGLACMRGGLVRARPRGGWRSNQYAYALRQAWLPGLEPEALTPARAQAALVGRYLEAFGPASLEDVQWWTGFTKGAVRAAVAALGEALVPVRVEGEGGEQWLPAEALAALRSVEPPHPGRVHLLPTLDPWVMATKHRGRLMGPEGYALLHDRNGNAGPSVVVAGRVVGGWAQRPDGPLVWRLFEDIGGEATRALEAEAARLEAFLGGERVMPNFPTPLMRELRG